MVRIHARNWQSAINVGLNELELRFRHIGKIEYRVRYWRCIASHSSTQVAGFSIDQQVIIAWMMVLFWGFVWPWLLIALHKRPLHRLVARIVSDVDPGGSGSPRRRLTFAIRSASIAGLQESLMTNRPCK